MNVFPSKRAIASATASNALFKPATRPVGLFFGGTSGIGQAMAEQLAKQTNGRAHIVLLGRNQTAAEKIIASFPKTDASVPPEEASNYSFVKVDATSMAEVRQVTSQLASELPKINFIVASPGFLSTKGRDETPEGIDKKLACHFYARFRFIHDLAPLVEKTAENGEQTGVISVFAAGRGGQVDLNFSLRNAEGSGVTYTDSMMQVS
jgi:NAD(P)-dependent dehydrogenase (short-subunit alcohol dehydrogenase family)